MTSRLSPSTWGARPGRPLGGGDGRLKFYFDEDVGGSYLTYANVVEDVLRAGRLDGYANFVEDSPEWKKRKPV